MKCIKVPVKEAQKTKKILIENNLLDKKYRILREKTSVFFPVNKIKSTIKILPQAKEVKKKLPNLNKAEKNLKKALEYYLTRDELEILEKSYDLLGNILIINIPEELIAKEGIIAEQLLKLHKNIKTILKKAGIHEGEFRTQKLKFLAGEKTKEAVYKENKATLKLNVEDVYFSPRTANERLRIAKLAKPNESILVMFSGCAPFPIVISKNNDVREITGIEINPKAHKYALENIKINKTKNIKLFEGDVRKIIPELNKTFDRIIMPLPKSADDFLDIALKACKKDSIIHFYMFTEDSKKAGDKVKALVNKYKRKSKILKTTICGQYSPKLMKVCVDLKLS